MITAEVDRRIKSTKIREKQTLNFLKKCGFFYRDEAYIAEGYKLDVYRRNFSGEEEALGDLKIGATCYISLDDEEVQSQQDFYLLNHTQLKRYQQLIEETGRDYMLYMMHIFEGDHLEFLNQRFDQLTGNDDPAIHLQEEISLLQISVARLCKLYNSNKWKIIELHPKLKSRFVTSTADGKIVKINKQHIGLYTDLTRQWKLLTDEERAQIRPS